VYWRPQESDKVAGSIHRLPRLKRLILGGSQVTDKTLDGLADHAGIEVLMLENTAVTDTGLVDVSRLPRLRRLAITGPQSPISIDGLNHMRGMLPALQVDHNPAFVWD
jgi:hypothetical protein